MRVYMLSGEKFCRTAKGVKRLPKGLMLADSTTIGLFKEILKTSGRKRIDGRQKGGIKAHTVIDADNYVPRFMCCSSAATHDKYLFKEFNLEAGDFICFDKAYIDYRRFYQWTKKGISMVTRVKKNGVYESIEELEIPKHCDSAVIKDEKIHVDTIDEQGKFQKLTLRRVAYWDKKKEKGICVHIQ
ncbi:MAG: transposase [Saprospiraceae bacterium]